ncbi:MAG: DUF4276 family protein [Desulfovibrio sp.]|nr:DUF4276 family protein [Desulfovibrio sp.]
MHFAILVEDRSGKKALDNLIPKIVRCDNGANTFFIHSYKGIGHIPKDLKSHTEANKRILLDQLPKLLKGFGRTFAGYGSSYKAVVIVVCDLDDKNEHKFLDELQNLLDACGDSPPETRFCLATEEGEAWLLGDIPAVRKAYPKARDSVLQRYKNDSVCGTWELLADAVYEGGAAALKAKGRQAVGAEKCKWASEITPFMVAENNNSPSFRRFRTALTTLADEPSSSSSGVKKAVPMQPMRR